MKGPKLKWHKVTSILPAWANTVMVKLKDGDFEYDICSLNGYDDKVYFMQWSDDSCRYDLDEIEKWAYINLD